MDNLPNDIIKSLLLYFRYQDIFRLFLLSRKYHRLDDESFWKLHATRKRLLITYRELSLLDELGHFDALDPIIIHSEGKCCIRWDISDIPTKDDALICYGVGKFYKLPKIYRKYIVFRRKIILNILYDRDPYEPNEYGEKQIILCTNTPVGSTLEYTLLQIYKAIRDDLSVKRTCWSKILAFKSESVDTHRIIL